ncbi:MAG: hypothetical protein Q8N96_02535 [Methylovulum sp.]|nr:hypothetical protein [Methylovulum sp.]
MKLAISKIQKLQVGHLMGFILDLTSMLKEPAGMVGAVVVIGAVYFLAKWVFAEHPDDEK